MWCSYAQKINCKKIILETTTFRVIMCFPLRNQFCKDGMNYLLLCLGLEIWLHSTQIHHHQTPLNKEFSTYKHHPSNISLKENLQYLSFVVWIKSNNETCIKNLKRQVWKRLAWLKQLTSRWRWLKLPIESPTNKL